jgi:hypothetical protein
MMSEEVNIHESHLPVLMKQKYEQWCRIRATDVLGARRLWFSIYQLLCDSRKCRIISDLKSLYTLPPYYTKEARHQLEASNRCCDEFKHSSFDQRTTLSAAQFNADQLLLRFQQVLQPSTSHMPSPSSSSLSPSSSSSSSSVAAATLNGVCHPVWHIISVWLERNLDMQPLWESVHEAAVATLNPHRDSISALQFFNKKMTHQEKPIYFYHAVLLVLFPQADHQVVEVEIGDEVVTARVDTDQLTIPDFCHDIHTGATDKV